MTDPGYEFVSGLDKSYSRRIRAHVLHKYHSQKDKPRRRSAPRKSDTLGLQSDMTGTIPYRSHYNGSDSSPVSSRPRTVLEDEKIQVLPGKTLSDHRPGAEPLTDRESCPSSNQNSSMTEQFAVYKIRTSNVPLVPLFKTSWSVFDTFSGPTSMRDRYLIRQFVRSTESPLYKLYAEDVPFNPPRDICFRVLMRTPLGRLVMATMGAYEVDLARYEQIRDDSHIFENKAFQMLGQRLQTSRSPPDDTAIISVVAFIARDTEIFCERDLPPDRKATLQTHIEGLRNMIISRGGFTAFSHNLEIGFHLHSYDMVNFGTFSAGMTPLSDFFLTGSRLISTSAPVSPASNPVPHCSPLLALYATELIGLYASLYTMMRAPVFGKPEGTTYRTINSSLATIFPPTSGLTHALLEPPTDSFPFRFACLIYLISTILTLLPSVPLPSSTDPLKKYLDSLSVAVTAQRLHITPSFLVLLWIMMIDRDDYLRLASPQTAWLVSRTLWVAKRLKRSFVHEIEEALLMLLFGRFDPVGSGSTHCGVEDAEHRQGQHHGRWRENINHNLAMIWEPNEFASQVWKNVDIVNE